MAVRLSRLNPTHILSTVQVELPIQPSCTTGVHLGMKCIPPLHIGEIEIKLVMGTFTLECVRTLIYMMLEYFTSKMNISIARNINGVVHGATVDIDWYKGLKLFGSIYISFENLWNKKFLPFVEKWRNVIDSKLEVILWGFTLVETSYGARNLSVDD